MHIGSLPGYLRGIAETIPLEDWVPGDCVVHNHPYKGASHSPDIAVVMPVFYKGELVGFSANTAHHVDIGAATPGLIIDVPDMWAEGMLLDAVKLFEGGKRVESMWKYIHDNTRVDYCNILIYILLCFWSGIMCSVTLLFQIQLSVNKG